MSSNPRPKWTVGIDGCTHPLEQQGSIDVLGRKFVFYCKVCNKRLGTYDQRRNVYDVYLILPPMGKTDYLSD